ncbi:cytidine and dCMP deaminase domain-containing protein 1 isoform X2 [Esox lucius]|uniref:Cytidine and dCMP deaminase domain-containing protein 1 n=1 Tax=Esox lucius TaxID=8010 RepID=A0A3P8ZIJ5_ESOLU|nr:cytidine and dCMP deaminase domain-containing protein 1 isoform X2 [Esox lucius]
METTNAVQSIQDFTPSCAASCKCKGYQDVKEDSIQTETKVQGHGPRLSKANLFTLLSLWMELFPREEKEDRNENEIVAQTRSTGLVVVRDQRVLGLHCSGSELHAGQVAVIRHGPKLAASELYFSRKPCATCLKMLINVGVSRISFWPGDPEFSLLVGGCNGMDSISQEAVLDAIASEKLKSNSRPHIGVAMQPLALSFQQFVMETSSGCEFMGRISEDCPDLDIGDLFHRQMKQNMDTFSREFLILQEQRHRDILATIGLENFCMEPYFSNLRQNMRELVRVLASVAASVPLLQHGFYRKDPQPTASESVQPPGVSQETARHCTIQARLLAYRTEDSKIGVGAVIWAEGKFGGCDGTGRLYLVGCGYNAYPVGSEYGEYPQMGNKQQDRKRRKYRYIIHAEQNALSFRSAEIREEENTMLFVTKCPCDECIPLIQGAGVKQIYTTDLDSGKDKGDISYLRFSGLRGVLKFIKTTQWDTFEHIFWLQTDVWGSTEDRLNRNPTVIRGRGQQ